MGRRHWKVSSPWLGISLLVTSVVAVAIVLWVHHGRSERSLKADLDRTLGEQLELAAEITREHGRQLADQAAAWSVQAALSQDHGGQPADRLTAFREYRLIATFRPNGTIVPLRSRLSAEDLHILQNMMRLALQGSGGGSIGEQYRVVKLPSGLFLVGFRLPRGRDGSDGLLLGVSMSKEILDHFRSLIAVEVGFFWHRPHSAVSPFQLPASGCRDCHVQNQKDPRPSPDFDVRRSFKSGTFYTRSFNDGFRYGFMGLEMADRRVAMLVARKPEPKATYLASGTSAVSSVPAAALLLVMAAVGGLLLRGNLRSFRGVASVPTGWTGPNGNAVASGVTVRDQATTVVESFRAVVSETAESRAQMEHLIGRLHSIVDAQSQETVEAKVRLGGLLEASRSFNRISSSEDLAETILRRGAELTRARWGRLTLLSDEENEAVIFDLTPGGKIVRLGQDAEHDSVSRKVIRCAKPLLISKAEAIATDVPLGDEAATSGFIIAAPLAAGDRVKGVITLCERRGDEEFGRQDTDTLSLLAGQAALALEHARVGRQAQEGYLQTILALANAIEAKDPYLSGHSERVTKYSMAIAREVEYDIKGMDRIRVAAELHDVGKVGIDLSILNKTGALNDEEWTRLRQHPEVGRDIIRPLTFMKEVGEYVVQHHEWYNGTGYPSGLAGEQIAPEARILSIADAFDAITSKRPYRPTRTRREALTELRAFAGTQFDPSLVDVAVRVLTPQ